MRSVISGLIGGAVAVTLTAYIARRVGNAGAPGVLRFGPIMWVLATGCLAMAVLPAAALVSDPGKEFWAKACLVLGFGLSTVYCFAEAAFVRGTFDQNGIVFRTPWTGVKREQWKDMVSVEQNDYCSWYALTFKSGRTIRLSRYLSGHLSALKLASDSVSCNNASK